MLGLLRGMGRVSITAAAPAARPLLPSPVPAAGALLALQVRHMARPMNAKQSPPPRRAGKGNGVWWQKLLPALANAESFPEVEGSRSNRLKKMRQRRQQSVWDHAKRKEGHQRSKIFAQLKRDKEDDKVRAVYAEYAEILRAKALAKQAEGDGEAAAAGDEAAAAGWRADPARAADQPDRRRH